MPSGEPSSNPSECIDKLSKKDGFDDEVWRMPNDSIWKDSSFVGHTCMELEQDFGEGNNAAWCETLSRGIFSDHTPMDACCACGGGIFLEASCTDLKFSDIEGMAFTCEILDSVPDVMEFCNEHGGNTFSSNGRTMAEACCACGGGEITTVQNKDKLEYQRRLVSSGSPLLQSSTLDRLNKDTARNLQGGNSDFTKTIFTDGKFRYTYILYSFTDPTT